MLCFGHYGCERRRQKIPTVDTPHPIQVSKKKVSQKEITNHQYSANLGSSICRIFPKQLRFFEVVTFVQSNVLNWLGRFDIMLNKSLW
jgi:hypothetical protein